MQLEFHYKTSKSNIIDHIDVHFPERHTIIEFQHAVTRYYCTRCMNANHNTVDFDFLPAIYWSADSEDGVKIMELLCRRHNDDLIALTMISMSFLISCVATCVRKLYENP